MRTASWAALGAVLLSLGPAHAVDRDPTEVDVAPVVVATPGDSGITETDDSGPDDADENDDDEGDETPAPAAPVEPIRKGLQLQGGFGLGDCLGGFCSHGDELRVENSRIGLGIGVGGWYRPIPLVSVGGGVHYNLIGLHDRERITSSGDYFTIELGGRFHPLQTGAIDPWAGVGFGYLVYGIASDFTESDIQRTETTNAIFLSLQAGAEWYFAPRMSFGGVLGLTFPSWLEQCLAGELDEDCDVISDLPPSLQNAFPKSFWYLGGTFSYHLGG